MPYIIVDDNKFFSGFLDLVIKDEIAIVEFINDANIRSKMLALDHIEKLGLNCLYTSLS